MELQVLGSSSDGNCYILRSAGGESLVVELGVPWADVKRALGFSLRGLAGCVVSHRHGDHARCVADALRTGVPVCAPPDVFVGLPASPLAVEARHRRGLRTGGFSVLPLSVEHDAPCMAYVISHAAMGSLLFVTDTMAFRYRVAGLRHVIIEANYSDEALDAAVAAGVTPASARARIVGSHMSIGTTLATLAATDLSGVREVVLLHLSARNSDAEGFKERVEAATGLPAYVAEAGLRLDLSCV